MNLASYNALKSGMDDLGGGLQRSQQMKKALKQQEFENQMRELARQLQQKQVEANVAGAERDFNFRKERAGVEDSRYADDTGYRRGRDTIGDQRYGDERTYQRGRDTIGDQRDDRNYKFTQSRAERDDQLKQLELALRMGQMKDRANSGYVTEDIDPESGEVISARRRSPLRTGGGPAAQPAPQPRAATGPRSPDELLAAVRSGKMTKADAKAYAKQQGWE